MWPLLEAARFALRARILVRKSPGVERWSLFFCHIYGCYASPMLQEEAIPRIMEAQLFFAVRNECVGARFHPRYDHGRFWDDFGRFSEFGNYFPLVFADAGGNLLSMPDVFEIGRSTESEVAGKFVWAHRGNVNQIGSRFEETAGNSKEGYDYQVWFQSFESKDFGCAAFATGDSKSDRLIVLIVPGFRLEMVQFFMSGALW